MKKIKKIIALFLVLAISAMIFSSCNEEKSKIVASYDGGKYVYEDDVDFSDFYNLNRYFHSFETGNSNFDTSEYNKILSDAVKETIIVRVFEEELENQEMTLDMDEILLEASNDAASFEAAYEGGFAKFCKDWNLSKDVFVLYNKYEAMKEMAKEFVEVEISDSEAKAYYNRNPEKYFKTPHYDINTLYLQVLDPSDEAEMAEAYNDAMIYIEILNSGRSWESVKETAFLKYNSDYGMFFTEHLSGLSHVSMKYFLNMIDLETSLYIIESEFTSQNGMTFKEMFPGSFEAYAKENELEPETKEYNKALEIYMNYASAMYNAEFEYAVTNYWEEGKTYYKPIYHAAYNSYVLVTFTGIEEEDITITFEEAKDDIIEILTEEEKEKAVENYISQRISDLKVQIQYK